MATARSPALPSHSYSSSHSASPLLLTFPSTQAQWQFHRATARPHFTDWPANSSLPLPRVIHSSLTLPFFSFPPLHSFCLDPKRRRTSLRPTSQTPTARQFAPKSKQSNDQRTFASLTLSLSRSHDAYADRIFLISPCWSRFSSSTDERTPHPSKLQSYVNEP